MTVVEKQGLRQGPKNKEHKLICEDLYNSSSILMLIYLMCIKQSLVSV